MATIDAALPPSVNYHLWAPCNMRCRYCFATFHDVTELVPRGHLGREDALRLVVSLAHRFAKVTFAGGEPTLCPWLADLLVAAKLAGATTMLVTNGSTLRGRDPRAALGTLDWLTLSIDSASDATHVRLGRSLSGWAMSRSDYEAIADAARGAGMRLKVNTVVTALNASEDMSELLLALRPERWKILQVLAIDGQNTGSVEPLLCAPEDFAGFVERHRRLEQDGILLVPEENDDILGSYAMVDPAGRFFDDVTGRHRYSAPILDVGMDAAWSQITFSMTRFLGRGGKYAF